MKKLDERSQWDKEWASAFEDASRQPSESVWHSIDGELAKREAQKYKKRAFFYQWAAAASFLLACSSIVFILLQDTPMEQRQKFAREDAQQERFVQESVPTAPDAISPLDRAATDRAGLLAEQTADNISAEDEAAKKGDAGNEIYDAKAATALAGREPAASQPQPKEGSRQQGGKAVAGIASQNDLPQNHTPAGIADGENGDATENMAMAALLPQGISSLSYIEQEEKQAAPMAADIRKVWMASDMLKKTKEESTPRYLLGASIASNYFNPNFQETAPSLAGFAAEADRPVKGNLMSTANMRSWQEEQQLNQPSINAGIQAAGWVGKKWVLQGGVQYGNYRSTTMAGSYMDVATAQAYPLHYANFSPDKMQRVNAGSRLAAPVSAINTFEFISVPLKLGYVVIDKKVGLMLSPGISSEIFLRNQLADANHQLSTYTIYGGEDAPFNRLHFRGVMGAQVFYKLGEHYMISLEPNYQHSITNFSKEGAVFQSRPSNMGISAGFRYIIR